MRGISTCRSQAVSAAETASTLASSGRSGRRVTAAAAAVTPTQRKYTGKIWRTKRPACSGGRRVNTRGAMAAAKNAMPPRCSARASSARALSMSGKWRGGGSRQAGKALLQIVRR